MGLAKNGPSSEENGLSAEGIADKKRKKAATENESCRSLQSPPELKLAFGEVSANPF
ncbi:hypothetical protein CA13_46100 [Planctomycetes bacterium CA13]|uniref:Uncharacterized protein n=1 Tax=Novipirellula herctigrandis TaxID=2527986 RepID=A0A5C5Z7S6_9BACT|nr:hypothetical protein CA13_46100 [Planctomycetes bacterium CA13]